MSKKEYANELSELLNIPKHKPIVGGTLSRDWLALMHDKVLLTISGEQLAHHEHGADPIDGPNDGQRLGKHAIIRSLFEMLGMGGADDHLSAGGTVKGTALAIILSALEARLRDEVGA